MAFTTAGDEVFSRSGLLIDSVGGILSGFTGYDVSAPISDNMALSALVPVTCTGVCRQIGFSISSFMVKYSASS